MEAINRIGPVGHYLGDPFRLKHIRGSFIAPEILDYAAYEQWKARRTRCLPWLAAMSGLTIPMGGAPGAPPSLIAKTTAMAATTHFAFFLTRDFSHIAFSCAVEPLRLANLMSGKPLYRWTLLSEDGVCETCSNGAVTLVNGGPSALQRFDRLFLISGKDVHIHVSAKVLAMLRQARATGIPLGAFCSGAYALAMAGLLDGVKTAVHWGMHDLFEENFPEVKLVRSVFVPDEKIITASGGTAAADLMLHLIAKAHGNDLATEVADQLVYNAVREQTAAQRVSLQSRHRMRNPTVIEAISIMSDNIEDPMSPPEIAARLGISTRQLERLFSRSLGASPSRYYRDMRLDRARNLLVQSERSIMDIALACGFNSASHFAKAFRDHFGKSPLSHQSRLS